MLILALFMVLFSNHMERRLQDGKSVLRVDCRMTDSDSSSRWQWDRQISSDETDLLFNQRVSVGIVYV